MMTKPALLFPSRSDAATRSARMTSHPALLITGAGGAFVAIEALADDGTSHQSQLTDRAKRLFKGQRAQLISYYVNETVEG